MGEALSAAPQEGGLDRAVQHVAELQFIEALHAARAEPDGLRRVQAVLYVYQQAGALDEALAEGLAGLTQFPGDAFLLKQSASAALTLGIGQLGARLVEDLRRVDASAVPAWMEEEIATLSAQRQSEDGLLLRAQWTTLILIGAAAVGILMLLRPLPTSK